MSKGARTLFLYLEKNYDAGIYAKIDSRIQAKRMKLIRP